MMNKSKRTFLWLQGIGVTIDAEWGLGWWVDLTSRELKPPYCAKRASETELLEEGEV